MGDGKQACLVACRTRFLVWVLIMLVTAPLRGEPPESGRSTASAGTAEFSEVLAKIERRVDASALRIGGFVSETTYAVSAAEDACLVRITECDKKQQIGKTVLIVQDDPGLKAGQPWPSRGKTALAYRVGTTPCLTAKKHKAMVPTYVRDRQAAITWALSQ